MTLEQQLKIIDKMFNTLWYVGLILVVTTLGLGGIRGLF